MREFGALSQNVSKKSRERLLAPGFQRSDKGLESRSEKSPPCPSFPCFSGIPCSNVFLLCEEFLVFFLSVVPFFSRDLRGSIATKNPCFFGVVFLAFSPKTRKGRTGQNSEKSSCPSNILSAILGPEMAPPI